MSKKVYRNHIIVECWNCGYRLTLPEKDLAYVNHMYCCFCNHDIAFEPLDWTKEDKEYDDAIRKDNRVPLVYTDAAYWRSGT